MILAAGVGSRLKSLTADKPKCLVTAGGKSMLEHTVAGLKRAGVTDIVINLHHFHDQVKDFCRQKNYFGLNIKFSYEEELLETGGGLQKVQAFFSDVDHFILHNSDVYTDFDLRKLVRFFSQNKNCLASLAVNSRPTSRPLLFNADGALAGWRSKLMSREELVGPAEGLQEKGFCGIHVISRKFFNFNVSPTRSYSIIGSYIEAARQGELINALSIDENFWIDIGTPDKLKELNQTLSLT